MMFLARTFCKWKEVYIYFDTISTSIEIPRPKSILEVGLMPFMSWVTGGVCAGGRTGNVESNTRENGSFFNFLGLSVCLCSYSRVVMLFVFVKAFLEFCARDEYQPFVG